MRFGGSCIAHDARMLGFYSSFISESEACMFASQELGREINKSEMQRWHASEAHLEALFLNEFLERSTPLIVHSPITAKLLAERCAKEPTVLPFCIYRSVPDQSLKPQGRAAARRRLEIDDDEIAVATFGIVQCSKAPEVCIIAIKLLRSLGIRATMHFVGSTIHHHDNGKSIKAMVEKLGITKYVRLPKQDFLSEQEYQDYLVAADLGIQLRTYDFGSISGALMDCAAAGLPTVTNASLAETLMLSLSYVRTIPNTLNPEDVARELVVLLETGRSAMRLGAEQIEFMR